MTSIHVQAVEAILPLLVGGLAVLVFHVVRALRVREQTARSWALRRGLDLGVTQVAGMEGYLRRGRWGRAAAALAFLGSSLTLTVTSGVSIGIVFAPYLLATMCSEVLAPTPQRGSARIARLAPRSATYFAPLWGAVFARVTLTVAIAVVLLRVVGLTSSGDPAAAAWAHLAVMMLGLATYETTLRAISRRGLPDTEADLQLDLAVRVNSARAATAAAVAYGTIGALWSLRLAGFDASVLPLLARSALGSLLPIAAVVAYASLVSPQASWTPRPPQHPAP
jgi:hypothetical protein